MAPESFDDTNGVIIYGISKKNRSTPGIRVHGTGVGIKNAGADKKSTNRVGICKRSFLRNNNILQ